MNERSERAPALAGRSVLLAAPPSDGGNRTTALRWALLWRRLGMRVRRARDGGEESDVLVALHATKSAAAVERWTSRAPGRPLVVALAGTDVYLDLGREPAARASLERADRIVALQELALAELPAHLRARARAIPQSAPRPKQRPPPAADAFEVVSLAHLRAVKDPLLPARAARLLSEGSRVRVLHAGRALEPDLARAAERAAEGAGGRWLWLGPLRRRAALELLWRARALVSSSRAEGGANAVSEALAANVPVLATRIPGATGILGDDHPGLFEPGDARGLAALLARCEEEPAFLATLARRSAALADLVSPERELDAWRTLFEEVLP